MRRSLAVAFVLLLLAAPARAKPWHEDGAPRYRVTLCDVEGCRRVRSPDAGAAFGGLFLSQEPTPPPTERPQGEGYLDLMISDSLGHDWVGAYYPTRGVAGWSGEWLPVPGYGQSAVAPIVADMKLFEPAIVHEASDRSGSWLLPVAVSVIVLLVLMLALRIARPLRDTRVRPEVTHVGP